MPRARRNTRCSRRCWRARPTPRCSSVSAHCAATRARSGWRMRRLPKPRAATNAERVEREYFDLFIGLGRGELLPYGSYYLTGFLHERPLARLREDLEPARHRARRRSGRAGRSRRDPVRDHGGARERPLPGAGRRRSRSCSSSISRPGSGASSPIWSGPRRRISTAASARSAACSSKSRRRPSRCRRERREAGSDIGGGDGDETEQRRRTLGRREFLRALGAGAGVAVAAAAPLAGEAHADTESNDEKRKSRYKETEHVKTFYRVNRYPS